MKAEDETNARRRRPWKENEKKKKMKRNNNEKKERGTAVKNGSATAVAINNNNNGAASAMSSNKAAGEKPWPRTKSALAGGFVLFMKRRRWKMIATEETTIPSVLQMGDIPHPSRFVTISHLVPMHYGTKPGNFETSKIHFPSSEGVSTAEVVSEASSPEQAIE